MSNQAAEALCKLKEALRSALRWRPLVTGVLLNAWPVSFILKGWPLHPSND